MFKKELPVIWKKIMGKSSKEELCKQIHLLCLWNHRHKCEEWPLLVIHTYNLIEPMMLNIKCSHMHLDFGRRGDYDIMFKWYLVTQKKILAHKELSSWSSRVLTYGHLVSTRVLSQVNITMNTQECSVVITLDPHWVFSVLLHPEYTYNIVWTCIVYDSKGILFICIQCHI